ncbi:hypothetical protein HGH92_28970 [Chitinophaga varians]|uniref:Tryptophan-rich sensory protein n=1 Tax=Chitinophaga varians TaxID=2202339 RepID=A0A847S1X5_9BACT|nr:tryptophan-rich sensory protein [Chitinophaga varians]NLR68374.1 hypothetical protein [Chitinophaga varians]
MMASHETLHYKNKSIFNTLAFLLMIATNALAWLLPINGKQTGEISDEYPHIFTPPGFTFSIWSLIYLSLLCFVIYQLWLAFSGKRPDVLARVMGAVKEWFLISCVVNATWLFAWHYELIPVTVGLILILLASLFIIHVNIGIGRTTASMPEKLFIHVPFSIYLGWISIATLANITTLLVYAGWTGSVTFQVWWTISMIAVGTLISILMVLRRNNILHALVAVWAFYGILVKRREAGVTEQQPVIHCCVIAIGIIAIAISWHLYRKPRS